MFLAWTIHCSLVEGFHYFLFDLGVHKCEESMQTTLLFHMMKVSNVAPHFDYLNPRNAMLPLMMILASSKSDSSTNGFT